MWFLLGARGRARRAAKQAAAANSASANVSPARPVSTSVADPPRSFGRSAEAPTPMTRSPSLPHSATPPRDLHSVRARTDMGTTADTSISPAMQSPHHLHQLHHIRHVEHAPPQVPGQRPPQDAAPIAAPVPQPVLPPLQSQSSGDANRNRRLSLDGDLPPSAIRPDHDQAMAEEHIGEGLFEVFPDAFRPSIVDVSACSKAGWEPVRGQLANVPPMHTVEVRKENQDAFCVFAPFRASATAPLAPSEQRGKDALQVFLGVFDGHGAEGRPIAHYARDYISTMSREASVKLCPNLRDRASGQPRERLSTGHRIPAELHRMRLETLKAAFSRAERALTESDSGIDHVFSGTTAVVSWLFGHDLYTAWAGDSRCVVGRAMPPENGRARFRAVDLSHDQKPIRADEKRRVRSAGGRIARWQRNMGPLRVWLPRDWTPGLAMTRSIGDTVLSEYGVSPVPEVSHMTLGPSDSFLVLASDGVWEFMTSQEVVDFIGRMRREGRSASEASEALVREAVRRWRRNEVVVDDTTAVVMWMAYGDVDDAGDDSSADLASEGGKSKSPGDVLLGKPRKVFSKTRAKVSLKPASNGVHLVTEDGHLADFNCKNDLFQGL